MKWQDGRAVLDWLPPTGSARHLSPLDVGESLAFSTGEDRRCIGLWTSGRRHRCPAGSVLAADRRGGQCELCVGAERSSSIATDTRLDDPRPFSVYLAHHGSQVKVGITAAERGLNRLVEQGALASVILSAGPLLAARRAEHLLSTALSLPERVTVGVKRAARRQLTSAGERFEQLRAIALRALALPAWPEAQQPSASLAFVDHVATYGLPPGGLAAGAELDPLAPGQTVTGRIVCRIASDLYLDTSAGLVLVDSRLLAGWDLRAAAPAGPFTAPLRRGPETPEALF